MLAVYAHINVTRMSGIDEYRGLAAYLRTVDGVIETSPFLYQKLDLSAEGEHANVLVKGIDPASASQVLGVDASSLVSDCETPTMFIGVALADELGVKVGGIATLDDPAGGNEPPQKYRIAETFSVGVADFDRRLVYAHYRQLQKFKYDGKDKISGIDLRLAEPYDSSRVESLLKGTLGGAGYTILE